MKQYSDTFGMREQRKNQPKIRSVRREVLGEVYGRSMGGLTGGLQTANSLITKHLTEITGGLLKNNKIESQNEDVRKCRMQNKE